MAGWRPGGQIVTRRMVVNPPSPGSTATGQANATILELL
jgi:hypothetical protein